MRAFRRLNWAAVAVPVLCLTAIALLAVDYGLQQAGVDHHARPARIVDLAPIVVGLGVVGLLDFGVDEGLVPVLPAVSVLEAVIVVSV